MTNNVEYVLRANEVLYSKVTQSISDQSTKRYNNDKMTLADLDKWKTDELPNILNKRYKKQQNCWLTKEELVLLMDWKLAKGIFRPILPKLIKSNTPEQVEDATKAGFATFLDYANELKNSKEFWIDDSKEKRNNYKITIRLAFKKICELKGVGPATASLILSLLSEINRYLVPPFFSDESFMYFVIDPHRPHTKIKYSVKEYVDELLESYFDILFNYPGEDFINMEILEKGGWSLKMYENHKFDSLADLKVPFEIENKYISSFHYHTKKKFDNVKGETEHNGNQPSRKKQKK